MLIKLSRRIFILMLNQKQRSRRWEKFYEIGVLIKLSRYLDRQSKYISLMAVYAEIGEKE